MTLTVESANDTSPHSLTWSWPEVETRPVCNSTRPPPSILKTFLIFLVTRTRKTKKFEASPLEISPWGCLLLDGDKASVFFFYQISDFFKEGREDSRGDVVKRGFQSLQDASSNRCERLVDGWLVDLWMNISFFFSLFLSNLSHFLSPSLHILSSHAILSYSLHSLFPPLFLSFSSISLSFFMSPTLSLAHWTRKNEEWTALRHRFLSLRGEYNNVFPSGRIQ